MMHSKQALYTALHESLVQIDKQIDAMERRARSQWPVHLPWEEKYLYGQYYADGKFMVADLVAARANVVAAMANLKASEAKK